MRSLILILLLLASCSSVIVEQGDTVTVTYTARYENGTLLDSNDPMFAAQLGKEPKPFVITAGRRQAIAGFDDALIGMRRGETKSVAVAAKDAYGTYDPIKVRDIPKQLAFDRYINVSRHQTVGLARIKEHLPNAAAGDGFSSANYRYAIESIDGDSVGIYLVSHEQRPTQFPQFPWSSVWVDGAPDHYEYEQNVTDGEVIQTKEGPYLATVTADKILLDSMLEEGMQLQSPVGVGIVQSQNEKNYVVNFNHPLAGRNLKFDITVEEIAKP